MNDRPAPPELAWLEPPYRLAITTFRDSIRAFADVDHELALTLKPKDRELDALTDDITERLILVVSSAPTGRAGGSDILML